MCGINCKAWPSLVLIAPNSQSVCTMNSLNPTIPLKIGKLSLYFIILTALAAASEPACNISPRLHLRLTHGNATHQSNATCNRNRSPRHFGTSSRAIVPSVPPRLFQLRFCSAPYSASLFGHCGCFSLPLRFLALAPSKMEVVLVDTTSTTGDVHVQRAHVQSLKEQRATNKSWPVRFLALAHNISPTAVVSAPSLFSVRAVDSAVAAPLLLIPIFIVIVWVTVAVSACHFDFLHWLRQKWK